MEVARSRNDVPIRLNDERWRHIVTGHPEMASRKADVLRAVSDPDIVLAGTDGELLAARAEDRLWIVVAYRETQPDDGFVLTAYITRRDPSARRTAIWTRQ